MKRRSALSLAAVFAILAFSSCASAGLGVAGAKTHAGHQLVQDELGEWTCPHCGGDYDGPGKCKNSYCGMDLVRKEKK